MRAAAGLDAGDAIRRQPIPSAPGIRRPHLGVDVIGDGGDVIVLAHGLAEQIHQPRSFRSRPGQADADAEAGPWGLGMSGDLSIGLCRPRLRAGLSGEMIHYVAVACPVFPPA